MDLPLPVDIFLNIFSRLPIKSLLICRCVCKTWLHLTSNPHLPKMHLSHASQSPFLTTTTFILYSQPSSSYKTQLYFLQTHPSQYPIPLNFPLDSWFNKFTVVDSCNGLICLSEISSHSHDIYLFNPSTGDYIQLPPFGYGEVLSFGFGFDSPSDNYKVVRINSDVNFINISDFRSSVNVYTLGDSKWRQARGGAFVSYYIDQKSAGVNVNGILHWKCYEKVSHHDYLASIACFDLTSEELHIIPFPDFINELDLVDKVSLVTLGGNLSFYRTTLHAFSWYRITVWVMKSYGVKESWTKQFVIKDSVVFKPSIKYAKPICLNNNGEILLLCGGKQLVAFNLQANSYREVGFYNTLDPVVAIAHVGTIVPLWFENGIKS